MGYDVSHHPGAPWYCNHITVVPLLPSVVYRNCKQRGICDLVFWILRDTALLTLEKNRLNLHISVRLSSWKHGCTAGENTAALYVQYAHTADTFHISKNHFLSLGLFPIELPSPLKHTFRTFLSQCLEKKA